MKLIQAESHHSIFMVPIDDRRISLTRSPDFERPDAGCTDSVSGPRKPWSKPELTRFNLRETRSGTVPLVELLVFDGLLS